MRVVKIEIMIYSMDYIKVHLKKCKNVLAGWKRRLTMGRMPDLSMPGCEFTHCTQTLFCGGNMQTVNMEW